MRKNLSPWLTALRKVRVPKTVDRDIDTDVLVVGAGIAGVTTCYQILKNTGHCVTLVDSHLAGHGASGHNAGQLTTYFERPLADIAIEYGLQKACEGQKAVESAWELLESIVQDAGLKTPVYKFIGYAALSDFKQILQHLSNNLVRFNGGLPTERIIISDSYKYLTQIPSTLTHLFDIASHTYILNLLETKNPDYVACLCYQKGATNSALICEELIEHLVASYPGRFDIFENSPVNTITLNANNCQTTIALELYTGATNSKSSFTVRSSQVILCTNGFEGFSLVNNAGPQIDSKFHHLVSGRVNYMSAYLDANVESPVAISYFPRSNAAGSNHNAVTGDQYFYITRRPHVHQGREMGLISTGGPERVLAEGEVYERDAPCDPRAEREIDHFLKHNYKKHKGEKIEYEFTWHGLLGYTTNGIRLIGEEPCNRRLLYNLGCNGIGIMPSIYGASTIAKVLNGEVLPPSIFDPRKTG